MTLGDSDCYFCCFKHFLTSIHRKCSTYYRRHVYSPTATFFECNLSYSCACNS